MARKDPSHIVAGAGLLTGIFTQLNAKVMTLGGTAEDLHRLTTPDGEFTILRMAELIVQHNRANSDAQLFLVGRLPVEQLDQIGVDAYNILKANQLDTVKDVATRTEEDLLLLGLSQRQIINLKRELEHHGLTLAQAS